MSALSKLNSLHIRVGELADYICISEWVTVICYTCKKTQSVQLFILDMWVKMQIKKDREEWRSCGMALRGLVCLWMRMALEERRHGLRRQTSREDERRDGDLLLVKTKPPHHHSARLLYEKADRVPFSFCLTHKPPLMYDVRGILCSVFFYLYEEGHSYSHQIHHPSPVFLNSSRQLGKQS